MRFTCPHCGVETLVGDQYVGKSGPCASCGNQIFVASPSPPAKPRQTSTATAVSLTMVVALAGFLAFCGFAGILIALLLPAVQAAREAARRVQCTNNLKQIALAMHNYHDTYQAFPPAYTVDQDGNRLHSWRTLILPFLEQQSLYDRIDLDQPWDSGGNAGLANTRLPVFQCPSDPSASLGYMVVVGTGTMFEGDQPATVQGITDGASRTVLVMEVTAPAISWMEPVDLDFATLNGLGGVVGGAVPTAGSYHPGGLNVAMADGSIRFIEQSISPTLLKSIMTRAGGESTTGF